MQWRPWMVGSCHGSGRRGSFGDRMTGDASGFAHTVCIAPEVHQSLLCGSVAWH